MSDTAKENKGRKFSLITDEEAKALAEVCPPHKIILDCSWGVPVGSHAVATGAAEIGNLAVRYADLINDTPELKEMAEYYSLEAHEEEKALFAMATRFGTRYARLATAIEEVRQKAKQPAV